MPRGMNRNSITASVWKRWIDQKSIDIFDYSKKFIGKKYKVYGEKNGWYIGCELETDFFRAESGTKGARVLHNALGDFSFIYKHDGSIHGRRTAEIVTSPRSFMSWDSVDLELVCSELRGLGFRSWENASSGFHMHFSAHDNLSVRREIQRLLSNFFADCRSSLETLSRRNEYGYCKFYSCAYDYNNRSNRYQAVNFCPKNTVEFRFPRGTLNPIPLRAYMQFCNALYSLCWVSAELDRSGSACAITWLDVESYLMRHRKTSVECREFLKSLRIWQTARDSGVELPPSERANLVKRLQSEQEKIASVLYKLQTRLGRPSGWKNTRVYDQRYRLSRKLSMMNEDRATELNALRR